MLLGFLLSFAAEGLVSSSVMLLATALRMLARVASEITRLMLLC